MNETVSVDKAISRGKKMIYLPIIFISLFVLLLPVYLHLEWGVPDILIFFGFFAAFLASWLYWSMAVTCWKLWAFRNVRNVHQLQTVAVREKLIWPAGHFFNKTEIWTRAQREEWKLLQRKFLVEDVFNDDPLVPKETAVMYSKAKAVFGIVMGTAIIVFVLFFPQELTLLFRFILGGVGAAMVIREVMKLLNSEVQLLINDKGFITSDGILYKWEDVSGEEAITEGYGKSTRQYFVFWAHGEQNKILMTQFSINARQLNNLLYIYRNRFLVHQQ